MSSHSLRRLGALVLCGVWVVCVAAPATAQGLGGAGTVQGIVTDPTGGPMQAVEVTLRNPVSGLTRTATTDATGKFTFTNLPPNSYHLTIDVQGFTPYQRDIDVRSAVPIDLSIRLDVGVAEAVSVVGHAEDLIERDPSAHTDIDASRIEKMPIEAQAGLNQVITLASPGIVADSNGFFHPIGDHAQTQFSIDNQPVTDQQSRLYSNQISPDAVESMEIITGVAPAEYGDKSSLVVHIVTKSGLDHPQPTGDVTVGYGSFASPTLDVNLGAGSHTIGNFVSASAMRTDRFLDPPEFTAIHDTGNRFSLFDRLDAHVNDTGTLHLNVQAARSSFDVPNSLDAETLGQAQHQTIDTFNVAPGYSQVIGSKTLFTANGYVRQDHLVYTPSPNPFADQPGSVSQDRTLRNVGAKADVAYTTGDHNIKMGGSISATPLHEQFTLAFTDPSAGFPQFNLALGGSPFVYDQSATIKQQAAYVQDDMKLGAATIKAGLRFDHYDGLTSASLLQPRVGVSYSVDATGTLLRASYGRTMETPYNENLLLSSGIGAEALTGTASPPKPGIRDQIEVGAQQSLGHWVVADVGYFDKHTQNAYDFNVLFNTPIFFPVAWDHSHINGFTGRVDLVEHRGFRAFVVMGHTNAIYFPPGVGGVLLEAPCDTPGCSFRIDHDQKFNSTTNVEYVLNRSIGAWAALSWRYDSGMVSSSIGDVLDLLTLTPAQQAAAGVACAGVAATPTAGFTSCAPNEITASRLVVPAAGTGDPLNNPTRVAPRNLFDVGLGIDNLLRTNQHKLKLRFSIINLMNEEALYNFLSTFSGTHFVTPRAYQVQVGWTF